MFSYIIRRLLLMFPTLLGITFLVFFVMYISPGGIGGPQLSPEGGLDPEQRRALEQYYNERYGLDQPALVQYGRWLRQITPIGGYTVDDPEARLIPRGYEWIDNEGVRRGWGLRAPDLGMSFARGRPVIDLLMDAVPITLLLNFVSIPIIYVIAIGTGIYAAKHRGKVFDLGSGIFFLALWSIPTIWAGVLLIGFLANQEYIQLFPTAGLHDLRADAMPFFPRFGEDGFQRGWLLDMAWHLVLPVACLVYGGFAFLSKLVRGSMLENIQSDFVRTARAKGLDSRTILFRHVFRNSLLPLITVAANLLPALLSGALIVETIFSIPGMGKLAVDAVFMRDREVVLATAFIGGFIGLLSLLIVDICYAIADPRVTYE